MSADMPRNTPEFTVSELAQSLKRTVEQTYGHVRVRGELGRVTIAKSGHCYLDVKDDKAVINSIIWKGVMGRLSMRPEEGMEVVCEGKLSTYPGRSNYQLIIDKMELAGAGALMALYEKRKKQLAAEGLFDVSRKQELPFLPKVIGVVTSPTGSVIRDILHRISDRFPSHVLVWPVLVQGERAAEQISAAITGFNHAQGFPRPDVLIVARGGGSMEDLWCFNEEIVARAAAASDIPLISAVGHETDWTLIDYVADYRAPTPTGAAEVAVPVRADWLETVEDYGHRSLRALRRTEQERRQALTAARLPRLSTVLGPSQQRLDVASAKLPSPARLFERRRQSLTAQRLPSLARVLREKSAALSAQTLPPPSRLIEQRRSQLAQRSQGLAAAMRLLTARQRADTVRQSDHLRQLEHRIARAVQSELNQKARRLGRMGDLLKAYSYEGVLERGYVLVKNAQGQVVRRQSALSKGQAVSLDFADGKIGAVIGGSSDVPDTFGGLKRKSPPQNKKPKNKKKDRGDKKQAELF